MIGREMQNSIHGSQADAVKSADGKLELPASAQEAIRILAQGFSKYFGSRGVSPLVPETEEK